MASAMPVAPAMASRAMSCQPDGLNRSGPLRTGALNLSSRAGRGSPRSEESDLESARQPGGAIERIARVEHAFATDQGRHEIHVELMERAAVNQQYNHPGVTH